ncbi:MAG: hypothetical protein LUC35_04110 [Clostridiales bacterium]|nr:hypothetical protein [Clostridiales bacterium]MCD7829394.1 hypothetical protein [Clostridiales bacterium]MCD7887211.1 hypothetical protein [Clostridiales bacterium]MCD8334531.1 hypothetical protein [Clostridiales bacterium]
MTIPGLVELYLLISVVILVLGIFRKMLKLVIFAAVLLLLWGGASGALTALLAAM